MKKIIYTLTLLVSLLSCNSQEPMQFSEKALNDSFINLDGNETTFKSILETHKGKNIVIDIWASWCSDCIKGMPKVKALQEQFPDVAYVFLSLDRGQDAWKRGIKKYNVTGDHYYLPNAKDCDFADFVNISWIPRYMLINKASEIVVFNVIEANDDKLIEALKK
ncbi:TlpA family protein disulfide reductase [Algibacter amylolyticus]|uniref:TlpA family protein disulfide reductase n=1 Tax=Algibacter amylolyticus TaxID=1608400 RepID=A0A5M7B883_9FLAO|nr:TlpA disulfide reductase family protein [Algibacter amylolyticus]KAA5824518.1 TlpA family protein disulfide reductase [Algibacter amylolyticus]MBB5269417.1 thiol-disulfide isomerase/thioredoxin [Algibacter amylolyticus]TSJ75291.1 TlpA family protein disulfide reductase [Algibacter amylolyticus]